MVLDVVLKWFVKNFLPTYTKLRATFSKGNISLGDHWVICDVFLALYYLVYRLYFQNVLKESSSKSDVVLVRMCQEDSCPTDRHAITPVILFRKPSTATSQATPGYCGSVGVSCLGFLWWTLTDKHKDTAPGPQISHHFSWPVDPAFNRFARIMPFFTTSLIYRTRINWISCACIYSGPFTTEFISDSGHYFPRICQTRRRPERLHNVGVRVR